MYAPLIYKGRSFYGVEFVMSNKEDNDLLGDQLDQEYSGEQSTNSDKADALEGELVIDGLTVEEEREFRVINRSFSLAEYSNSFTKIQWLLFIEIYETVKQFYLDRDDQYVESFSMESIIIRVPVNKIDSKLFDPSNRSKQLRDAAEGLMDMRVRNYIGPNKQGQMGFDFISMFPRITYNPTDDKDHIIVKVQSEIYEEMVPIQSYAQLDLKLLEALTTGNAQRLYAIFKSYAFKPKFTISFESLRRQMGFFESNTYPQWKYFNSQVLKPAVEQINKHKKYDIAVTYEKPRGKDEVVFKITNFSKQRNRYAEVLSLNEVIDAKTRIPNRLQRRYLQTTLKNCSKSVTITDLEELMSWIISDIISMQRKVGLKFDFKHAVNSISKQIINRIYTEPFSHQHLLEASGNANSIKVALADEFIQREISRLEKKGLYDEIRLRFTDQELIANRYQYLVDQFNEDDS